MLYLIFLYLLLSNFCILVYNFVFLKQSTIDNIEDHVRSQYDEDHIGTRFIIYIFRLIMLKVISNSNSMHYFGKWFEVQIIELLDICPFIGLSCLLDKWNNLIKKNLNILVRLFALLYSLFLWLFLCPAILHSFKFTLACYSFLDIVCH